MIPETARQAAKRLAKTIIAEGYEPERLHVYRDEAGEPLYWRIRAKHPKTGDKWIRPMKLNGRGYELGEPSLANGKPLYNLDQIAAAAPDASIWICEGEKAADALAKLGVVATTSGGAQSAAKADWTALRGCSCIIWPDNDKAGKGYAGDVANELQELGCAFVAVDIDRLGLEHKADVHDWAVIHPEATTSDLEALPTIKPAIARLEQCPERRGRACPSAGM